MQLSQISKPWRTQTRQFIPQEPNIRMFHLLWLPVNASIFDLEMGVKSSSHVISNIVRIHLPFKLQISFFVSSIFQVYFEVR